MTGRLDPKQPLTLAFYGRSRAVNVKLMVFTAAAGLIMSALPMALVLPGLDRVYYGRMQNLAAEHLPLVREAARQALGTIHREEAVR